MHPENPHHGRYDFAVLTTKNPSLKHFVFVNEHKVKSIDFANPEAVFHLNKALLIHFYRVEQYELPDGYLCPAVPGRADYLCHLNTFLRTRTAKEHYRALDIGVGANCIYPIIGAQHFGWDMVGVDIHQESVDSARRIVVGTRGLDQNVEIRFQKNKSNIFNDTIEPDEFFDFTICNPPFYSDEGAATKSSIRKISNLSDRGRADKTFVPNFGGNANELWCNGGEALFIKRMIKQSLNFKKQVGIFTTLVSKEAHLPKLFKQLEKAKAGFETIPMHLGNKRSRILVWYF